MNIPLSKIPIMPLREVVLFPRGSIALLVGREFTIRAIGRAVSYHSRKIFMVTQRNPVAWDIRSRSELFEIGAVAKILEVVEGSQPDTLRVLLEGLYRARFIPYGGCDPKHVSRKVTSLADVYPCEEHSHPVSEQPISEFLSALNAYIVKVEKPAPKVIERIINREITLSPPSPTAKSGHWRGPSKGSAGSCTVWKARAGKGHRLRIGRMEKRRHQGKPSSE